MIDKGINVPESSSCGRLFDAVGVIAGISKESCDSTETAKVLESLTVNGIDDIYRYAIYNHIIDYSPMIEDIMRDMADRIELNIISTKFHNTIIDAAVNVCGIIRNRTGLNKVCLSGGVFYNKYLSNGLENRLINAGFESFKHKDTGSGDSGLSLGQAVIGARSSDVR